MDRVNEFISDKMNKSLPKLKEIELFTKYFVLKCENPFPNLNPIIKSSYVELDIIVSRLVFSLEA